MRMEVVVMAAMLGAGALSGAETALMAVGGYTKAGTTEGIHLFEVNTRTGAYRFLRAIPGTEQATYLCFNRAGTRLYAAMRDPKNPDGRHAGAVAAFAVNDNHLTLLGIQSVGPTTVPCHLALDPSEKTLVWAEYTDAFFGTCELDAQGNVTDRVQRIQDTGDGPNKPRQDKAHAHWAGVTPDGKFLCVNDLGIDQVKVIDFKNRANGLRELAGKTVHTTPGLGPRHLVFHPNGQFAFLIYELENKVTAFRYTGEGFVPLQMLSTLPEGFKGESKAAAIKCSADGTRLFASNRGHNSIAVFSINPQTGALALLTVNPLKGAFPRDCQLLPGERFMVVGHKLDDNLMVYAYEAATGKLTPTGEPFPIYHPTCFIFR